jgi:D-cysteine desulfhydrase
VSARGGWFARACAASLLAALSSPALASDASTPLARAYPSLAVPRVALVQTPTPLEPLAALERRLRGAVGDAAARTRAPWLWIKRDDVADGLVGGNKARKLEFLLGEARARGATGIVTSGRLGTHLGVAAAEAARRLGLRATVVLAPQPVTAEVRKNLLALQATGAELRIHGSMAGAILDVGWLRLRALLGPARVYYIPPSGTSAVGSIGYANAFLELVEQGGGGPEIDEIVVPASTGGTAAGLLAGICLAGRWERTRLHAVAVTDPWLQSEWLLRWEARDAFRTLRDRLSPADRARVPDCDFMTSTTALTYVRGYLGPGYGKADAATEETVRLLRELQGVELDTTYAGKAMRHFVDRAAERLRSGETGRGLLFWNTYAPVDLDRVIARHAWSDPAAPWRDLPATLRPLFSPAG